MIFLFKNGKIKVQSRTKESIEKNRKRELVERREKEKKEAFGELMFGQMKSDILLAQVLVVTADW